MDRLTSLLSRLYGPDARDARIAELEAMVQTQTETIASLNKLLDGVAIAVVGEKRTRIFVDLPEMRTGSDG